MNFLRANRVAPLIHEELSLIMVRELEFPNMLVTVTTVDVDKKMERALVGISVIPSSKSDEAMKILEKASGYLFHLLFKKLNIKPMPHLMFRLDRGFENAAKIERQMIAAGIESAPLKKTRKTAPWKARGIRHGHALKKSSRKLE